MAKAKPKWQKLMQAGEKALAEQDFDQALSLFEQALGLAPDNAELYKWIGRVHNDQGDEEEAEKYYRLAIEKDPTYWAAYNNLGVIYKTKELYEQAFRFFEQANILNPDSALPLYGIGQVYKEQAESDKAIYYFLKAQEKDPSFWAININLGYIYIDKEQYAQALKEFQKALDLKPKSHRPYFGLAHTYLKLGNIEKAENKFQLGLNQVSDELDYYYHTIGNKYRWTGYPLAAISYYKKAQSLNPKAYRNYLGLSCAYQGLKDYAKALHYGKKAIACSPWVWNNYHQVAACFYDLNIAKESIAYFEKAFQLAPEEKKATHIAPPLCAWLIHSQQEAKLEHYLDKFLNLDLTNKTHIHKEYIQELIKLAKYAKSKKQQQVSSRCLDKIVELAPTDCDILNQVGELFINLKEKEKAESCFSKALEYHSKSTESHLNLAKLYFNQNLLELAAKHYKLAIHTTTNSAEPYIKLAEIYMALAQQAKAYWYLSKGLRKYPKDPELLSHKLKILQQRQNNRNKVYIQHLLEMSQALKLTQR